MKKLNIYIITALLFFSGSALAVKGSSELTQKRLPDEYVVVVRGNLLGSLKSTLSSMGVSVHQDTHINRGKSAISVVRVKTKRSMPLQSLQSRGRILSYGPNYIYEGDPRESSVNDPMIEKQEHHTIMATHEAWKENIFAKDTVIVAVTDDGVLLNHEDLKDAIWTNKNEIPNNGIDDDENGFVDDVNGWDFTDEDNNPSGGSHGTHVAGIIGAVANNNTGLAGVGSGARIMPIRWYGGRKGWTTELIVQSYLYAMNNGAKIINTSYNIDRFATDKVYLETVKHLRENGVLIFNSAGNAGRKNPPRQEIEDVVLVASSYGKLKPETRFDTKSSFSNYGTGIDITAPGENILATTVDGKYGNMSGTSMASPNAAGLAALIWSQFPRLTADEVLHKMFTAADNIDDKNSRYIGLLGAGRVNTAKANIKETRAAKIQLVAYDQNTSELSFKVKGMLSKKALKSLQHLEVQGVRLPARVKYAKSLLRVKIPQTLPRGKHQVSIEKSALVDVFGNTAKTQNESNLGILSSKASFNLIVQ